MAKKRSESLKSNGRNSSLVISQSIIIVSNKMNHHYTCINKTHLLRKEVLDYHVY